MSDENDDLQTEYDSEDEQEVSDFGDEDDNKSDEQIAFECKELEMLFSGFEQFERGDKSLREYRYCFNKIDGAPLEHLIRTNKLGVWCYYYGLSYDDAKILFGDMDGFESSMVMDV